MNLEAVFHTFPVIQSDTISLQKIEDRHLDAVYDIYSNDRVFEYCGIIPKHNKKTVQSMIGHFERDWNKRQRIKWGIFSHDGTDQPVGIMEAFDFSPRVNMVTIGYFLAEKHWGQGLATSAVQALTAFLFEEAGVNRIQAEVMPPNERSKKVLLKNGFMKEGTLRQAAFWSGKGVIDLEIYSVLKQL
ncbi:GNAT family N-acetyltransferase [Paenibacillus protaetiae]|uniref:N-acetyltransferase n=1 Tax=Paenibacillus protaetiae TaxID=2509456 RepID=A0A4V0YFA0_9BACL|nr:GNAT family protein [Paenibacillus protaetiae]QAY66981.1 N-acetyltransferase [Paenibacillus protaetiae]